MFGASYQPHDRECVIASSQRYTSFFCHLGEVNEFMLGFGTSDCVQCIFITPPNDVGVEHHSNVLPPSSPEITLKTARNLGGYALLPVLLTTYTSESISSDQWVPSQANCS